MVGLTQRERQIESCIDRGLKVPEIAAELGISERQVNLVWSYRSETEGLRQRADVEQGSQLLAAALKQGGGMKPLSSYERQRLRQQLSRDDGMSGRKNEAAHCTTLTVIPIRRPCPVERRPAVPLDTRPPAFGREPCPYCGTRGDLGCAHFAPCEQVGA